MLSPGTTGVIEGNMEQKSLDDILSGEPEGTEEVVAEPQPEPSPPRDEHGRFAPKGVDPEPEAQPEPVAESPSAELPKEEYTAMRGERERRQKAEREADELRQRLEALEAKLTQPKEPPAPPPSVWEDEQAFGGHIVNQAVGAATFNAKLDMSEMMASQAHEDFDEMKAEFLKMAEQNPAVAAQALEAKHPWEKAYQIAKNARTMQELGATDLATMEAKLREKIMAEMAAQQPASVAPAIPPSLSAQRNAGARTGPAWSGPPSLNELLS